MKDDLRYTPSNSFETFPFPHGPAGLASFEGAGQTYYEARANLMVAISRGLTATYNRFCDPNDQDPAIIHLRALHDAMDRAVLDAYGWTDLHPVAIHEREWDAAEGEKPAPWRLRWPEADRDEVLARLLDLNRRRKEDEAAPDTSAPKPPRKPRGRRGSTSGPSLFGGDA